MRSVRRRSGFATGLLLPAIALLARSGGARWLVWSKGSGPAAVDDLLPLFDDPATFAVSRQSDYRAWRPVLLPTAPFRTLQPGERTRVMAPLGSTIVVDLRKLMALGVPDVSHPITAWMLLFWKAAAAGWHCYSAGQSAPLRPQEDFPTEETAFFLRVALDPACNLGSILIWPDSSARRSQLDYRKR